MAGGGQEARSYRVVAGVAGYLDSQFLILCARDLGCAVASVTSPSKHSSLFSTTKTPSIPQRPAARSSPLQHILSLDIGIFMLASPESLLGAPATFSLCKTNSRRQQQSLPCPCPIPSIEREKNTVRCILFLAPVQCFTSRSYHRHTSRWSWLLLIVYCVQTIANHPHPRSATHPQWPSPLAGPGLAPQYRLEVSNDLSHGHQQPAFIRSTNTMLPIIVSRRNINSRRNSTKPFIRRSHTPPSSIKRMRL